MAGKLPEAGRDRERLSPAGFRGSVALPGPQFWISGLQHCETLNPCGLKQPSLWYFVTATAGHKYCAEERNTGLKNAISGNSAQVPAFLDLPCPLTVRHYSTLNLPFCP